MTFTLLDRIVSIEPHMSITATKNLSLGEEYLADHFPGNPVMLGVLQLEAMVQAAAWLLRVSQNFSHSVVVFADGRSGVDCGCTVCGAGGGSTASVTCGVGCCCGGSGVGCTCCVGSTASAVCCGGGSTVSVVCGGSCWVGSSGGGVVVRSVAAGPPGRRSCGG